MRMITRRALLALVPLGLMTRFLKVGEPPRWGTETGRFKRFPHGGLTRHQWKQITYAQHYGMSAERFKELHP